ncbi:MAG: oligoendopeptidase F [Leptospiraceae bacterium]|nr:oligoendopeptidase F [Leptospiraceae bacterium]
MEKILKRKDVAEEETWVLDDLFKNFGDWENSFNQLPKEEELDKIINDKFKGKLKNNPEVLFECLKFKDNLSRKLENLYVYANLRSSEDVANKEANEFSGKIEVKMTGLFTLFAFLDPEILTIPNIESWLEIEPLNVYKYQIQELLRFKSHILSEKEEAILSQMGIPLRVFNDIHSKWNNADLKFQSVKDSNGKEHLVSNSRLSTNMESFDRTLRENSFHSYYTEIAKWGNTITANYYGNMVSGSTVSKIRNYPSFIEAELFKDDIPVSLYDNLIATVRKNLDSLHQSMELRKKILGIDLVAPYDRYVSLFKANVELKFTWEEGRDLVLSAIEPLGKEYVSIAKQGLTVDRWIDRAENEGKRSGAFSWGTYDSRPYMLQTWSGSLSDIYTLAHELGHSMHSYYSHKNQPYHYGNYTIFVAEVASTLNEALLTNYILQTNPNSDLAKSALSESIGNFEGTVLRQVLFAAFEKEAAAIADSGDVFTPEKMDEIYMNLVKEWYGANSAYPDFIKHEWMRIPHFYSPFYVYKYATSYCASLALCQSLNVDIDRSKEQIFTLLKSGGSKPSLEILKTAGVDLLQSEAIDQAFDNYKQNLKIAEKLFLSSKF